ncbi:unnamed protein product [Prunus armeniaca]|uniref:Uncharacterized protein n=2 Tax=Prunus armeniaca TaxID=36596 RepID=A0A6J5XKL6_PRUAR|nr:unnamed protein product [Prunus armeniaca]
MLEEIQEIKMVSPDWVRNQLVVRLVDGLFAVDDRLFAADDRVLYLCFAKYRLDNVTSYVVEAIKLNSVLSSLVSCLPNKNCSIMPNKLQLWHSTKDKLQLKQVASKSGKDLPAHVGCGVFGSKVLFAGGVKGGLDPEVDEYRPCPCRQIFEFETDRTMNPNRSIKLQAQIFRGRKAQPLLQEIEGKLYSLGTYQLYFHASPYFEVFDPQEGKWSPLPDPPVFLRFNTREVCHSPQQYCFTIAGANIIMSCIGEPVYCFDVADSINKVWRVLPGIPSHDLNFQGRALAVDYGEGDFIIFCYGSLRAPNAIPVYLLPKGYSELKVVKPMQLPTGLLPPEFVVSPANSRFIHLGGRTVCLVLSRFMGPFSCYYMADIMKISVCALIFEFKVSKDRRSVDFEFLCSRILECDGNCQSQDSEAMTMGGEILTSDVELVGAFVM